MGKFFYWLTVKLYIAALYLARGINDKAKKMLDGRRDLWPEIENKLKPIRSPRIWFHCASLGEFEQGRPVIENIKEHFPQASIVVTFFSPSGYDVRKNYKHADAVFYLPFDSRKNAEKLVELLKPDVVYFVKYEFWYFYLSRLREKQVPVISISSIFRPGQLFFKPYGGFYRKILSMFDYFFVQNTTSRELLNAVGLQNVAVSGDTRFDRVWQICSSPTRIPIAENFKGVHKTFVIGSSWPNDIDVLCPFINEWIGKLKFIIAPHELAEKNLRQIEEGVKGNVVRFSKVDPHAVLDADVLLIDNIGMLSSLYSYADFAYVGGSFNSGLHNTLEAAAYGIPIFIGRGPKNVKYQEAVDLMERNAIFEISEWKELNKIFKNLYNNREEWEKAASEARKYVLDNLGATEKIITYSEKYLKNL